MQLDRERPGKIFTSLQSTCKGTKLKEFQFKLIHRIVIKNNFFRYGLKTDDECLSVNAIQLMSDSLRSNHTFIQSINQTLFD